MDADVSPSPSPARRTMIPSLRKTPTKYDHMSMDHMDHVHDHAHKHKHADENCGTGWWAFVFYFLVIAIILYFVFFALRPSFVLNGDDCSYSYSKSSYGDDHYDDREINNGKLLASAIIGALILIFVFWLFWYLLSAVY
jgi:hypothetical protein